MIEHWKEIKDYPMYEVSSLGRVRSWKVGNGSGKRRQEPRYMKLSIDKYGYPIIGLSNNKSRKTKKIHRLVAEAFIPNFFSKEQVNHINGIKIDNWRGNLEWVTNTENQRHAYKTGLNKGLAGDKHPSSNFTNEAVRIIRRMFNTGLITQKDLAYTYGVSRGNMCNIINNKKYVDVQ